MPYSLNGSDYSFAKLTISRRARAFDIATQESARALQLDASRLADFLNVVLGTEFTTSDVDEFDAATVDQLIADFFAGAVPKTGTANN